MKKVIRIVSIIVVVIFISACASKSFDKEIIKTVEGNLKTYNEMSDGTWKVDDNRYQYKLEITGRMSNADADSTFVYLSNLEEITFEQAWKAAGFSSLIDDYFTLEEAVLVDMK